MVSRGWIIETHRPRTSSISSSSLVVGKMPALGALIAPIQRVPNAFPANIITYMGRAKCFLTYSCLALAMRGVFVEFVALLTRNAVANGME